MPIKSRFATGDKVKIVISTQSREEAPDSKLLKESQGKIGKVTYWNNEFVYVEINNHEYAFYPRDLRIL